MTNDEMTRILNGADVPELDDAARERIVSSALIRYRQSAANFEPAPAGSPREWLVAVIKPAFAVAAAVVVILGVQTVWSPTTIDDPSAPATDQYNVAVFEEYRTLFEDDLRAVVARNGDVDVVLGGRHTARANPIVLIRIVSGGKPVYITAYSGQTIETEIGGKMVTLDILTTSDQEVLVASDEFMLEGGVFHGSNSYRADAHIVELSL